MADEDFEDESPNSKISRINAAGLINLTISNLWNDSYKHSRIGELSKWNADLNCLWIELAGDVEEDGDDEKNFQKIENKLATSGNLKKDRLTGFKKTSSKETINFVKQYQILMEKAVFLKRLQNKQGKGTAYQDDADDYMD